MRLTYDLLESREEDEEEDEKKEEGVLELVQGVPLSFYSLSVLFLLSSSSSSCASSLSLWVVETPEGQVSLSLACFKMTPLNMVGEGGGGGGEGDDGGL